MYRKKRLVVITGAGISAESGIKTFRDSDGTWEKYNVMDVAHIDGWRKNRQLVLDFYNERRQQLKNVVPNSAHLDLVKLEKYYDVQIITQNVDDLHERAGSTKVLHLHGELTKLRTFNTHKISDWPENFELVTNSCDENGELLRPHIVWFGEDVSNMGYARLMIMDAEIVIIIGTSLQVYPAAKLIDCIEDRVPTYLIDPNKQFNLFNIKHIKENATVGMESLLKQLTYE